MNTPKRWKDGQPVRLLFPLPRLDLEMVAFDLETHLMSAKNGPLPMPICASFAAAEGGWVETFYETALERVKQLLEDESVLIVTQNGCFDFGCMVKHFPFLAPQIIKAHEDGRIYDTKWAERLIDLQATGVIGVGSVKGQSVRKGYSLSDMSKSYAITDMTEMKSGPDAWRTRYSELEGFPLEDWPKAAIDYPIADAEVTLAVAKAQLRVAERLNFHDKHHPLTSLPLQCAKAFALTITGAEGIKVDVEVREQVREEYGEQFREATAELIRLGIMSGYEEARPAANGAKHPDGSPKMVAPKEPKTDTKALKSEIRRIYLALGLPPNLSDSAEKVPEEYRGDLKYVATSAEALEPIPSGYSEVIDQWRLRQEVAKVMTTELPRISPDLAEDYELEGGDWQGEVWTQYDALKETGRSSASASKLYPSLNAQNIAAAMRKCFVARPGEIMLSHDFRSMELVSAGQRYLDLVGHSVTAEKINAGVDLHAYLGAEIATATWQPMRTTVGENGDTSAYEIFLELKKIESTIEDRTGKAAFKHFRTMAKPTGLGFPGGLGVPTFVTYAKVTYGVELTKEEAGLLRDIWRSAYPEIPAYFKHTTANNKDLRNSYETSEGKEDRYYYITPGGMMRSGCHYCQVMNGSALQSPSAEGALYALFEVVKAQLLGTAPKGVRAQAFVHDEIIVTCPDDRDALSEASAWLDGVMCSAFDKVAPDVKSASEAGPMRRWTKAAEPKYDSDGKLMVWEDFEKSLKNHEVSK